MQWKALVRRHEALAAAQVCGVPSNRLHFLDLPFYHAATTGRRQLGERDVEMMRQLLQDLQPHLIFAAGDLDDPHSEVSRLLAFESDTGIAIQDGMRAFAPLAQVPDHG